VLRSPAQILLSIPAILIGLTFHELAHAWMADRLGDPTPRSQGRLSLNPLVHLDLMGILAFVFLGIGWAKPVQTNPYNFKKLKRDFFLVSFAGPVANWMVGIVVFFVEWLLLFFWPQSYFSFSALYDVLHFIILMNFALFWLNLLPIPPLDGYQMIRPFVPRRYSRWLGYYEQYGFLLLLALLFLGGHLLFAGAQWMFSILVRFLPIPSTFFGG